MRMVKQAQVTITGILVAAGLVSGGIWSAWAAETSENLASLPAGVRAAFEALRPGETPTEVEKEIEDGKVVYEAEYRGAKGDADITVDADGKLVVTKTKVKAKDLPEAITKAVQTQYKGATIKEAESTNLGYYELDLRVNGKKVEIVVQDDGTVKTNPEEDDADDEDEDEVDGDQ